MPKKRHNLDSMMSKRNGVTLVEMLVVVGVLALLVSLTLPAVQSARDASRRTIFGNNLRQIGIAISSFHSKKNYLPIGQRVLSQIASELEIPTVYVQFFGQQIQVAPPILRCPSEPSSPFFGGEVNYFMSVGSAISPLNGAASPDFETRGKLKKLSYGDFADGLSNTALFSENLQLQISCTGCHPTTKWWRSSVRFGPGEEIAISSR
jgi:prepilin-type N-terminal cleavage/methylation domain-containing protein